MSTCTLIAGLAPLVGALLGGGTVIVSIIVAHALRRLTK